MLLIIGSSTLVAVLICYTLFMCFQPDFGGKLTNNRRKRYSHSKNFRKGKFVNEANVPVVLTFRETLRAAFKFYTKKVPNASPKPNLSPQTISPDDVRKYQGESRLIWFGHSAFLFQSQGINVLIDPMFGMVPAPHPLLGSKRFSDALPISISDLPDIDAVIISHDHYDHLDYHSIIQLKDQIKMYFVPLGIGTHLEAWGIDSKQIKELDWWHESEFMGINLVCTPAQHFSGRKLGNGGSTLWCSWVIQTKWEKIFYSGDSGYAPHFKAIGEKYGPFDLALMECGQYDELWTSIHMMPEESAQAGIDVKAKKIMPIHWAGFKLAVHSWTDPVERVIKKCKDIGLPIIVPNIGEPFEVLSSRQFNKWW